jgi:hypothetical protein
MSAIAVVIHEFPGGLVGNRLTSSSVRIPYGDDRDRKKSRPALGRVRFLNDIQARRTKR